MKTEIPARTAEVCDRCHREGFLQTCIRCGGRYCLTCDGIVAGCVVSPDVCRECSHDPVVVKLCEEYSPKLQKLVEERDAKIGKAKKKTKPNSAREERGE
jgi:hypothetical protein